MCVHNRTLHIVPSGNDCIVNSLMIEVCEVSVHVVLPVSSFVSHSKLLN